MSNFSNSIRIAILIDSGNFKVNTTSDDGVEIVGGYEGHLLKLLLGCLNLRPVVQIIKEKEWGRRMDDGTYTGLVGMVSRDEADIAVGTLLVTEDRAEVVDFSYPYFIQTVTFATKMPGMVTTTEALLMPFSLDLWLGTVVALILLTAVLSLFLYPHRNLVEVGCTLLGHLLSQSSDLVDNGTCQRFLLGMWVCCTTILTKIYGSFLLASLTMPARESGIKNIQDLSRAVVSGSYECYVTRGSSLLQSLFNSRLEDVRNIATTIKDNEWYLETPDEFKECLHKEQCAIIRTRQFIYNLLQDDIFVSDDYFFTAYSAIVLKKNFPLKFKLNMLIQRIAHSGIYFNFLDNYLFRERVKKHSQNTRENIQIGRLRTENFSGTFLFLISGHSLAMLICFLEIIHWKIRKATKTTSKTKTTLHRN